MSHWSSRQGWRHERRHRAGARGRVMAKEIHLTKGKIAIVSDEDYEVLSRLKWKARWHGNSWYAYRKERRNGHKHDISMHRKILNAPPGVLVDHKDGDGLNNQRDNLRICNSLQNAWNSCKRCTNKSGYKGVTWHTQRQKWQARIRANGPQMHLGLFESALAAARAYDVAALKYHGEFARLNFPDSTEAA